jgi:hypothetical protein
MCGSVKEHEILYKINDTIILLHYFKVVIKYNSISFHFRKKNTMEVSSMY